MKKICLIAKREHNIFNPIHKRQYKNDMCIYAYMDVKALKDFETGSLYS